MKQSIIQELELNPVIAAVRNKGQIDDAIESPAGVIFILKGNILELEDEIAKVKKNRKKVFIHLDLTEGIGKDAGGVKYMAKRIMPDGLISTHSHLLKLAKDEGLLTVQRMFLVDSSSIETGIKLINSSRPDFVEVMPGLVPEAVNIIRSRIYQPIIAGGMITTKKHIIDILKAGAIAASTSSQQLWHE
ncbi:MAG: glycerol-3-phosphate responsive antiterminator [Clostridia bacterium]|nr:glycerol-3-phosphate responsive antiterminator [Clostridia bacterium]